MSMARPVSHPSNHCRRTDPIWTPPDGRVLESHAAVYPELDAHHPRYPDRPPRTVLMAVVGPEGAWLVARDDIPAFLGAHPALELIFHGAARPLAAFRRLPGLEVDLDEMVERGRIWDTAILHRLHRLMTAGDTAPAAHSLDDCTRIHLGRPAARPGPDGALGGYLGRPLSAIPDADLTASVQAGRDVLELAVALRSAVIAEVDEQFPVSGGSDADRSPPNYREDDPFTHHTQLKAAILAHRINATGIGTDPALARERVGLYRSEMDGLREPLRRAGILVGETSEEAAVQALLWRLERISNGVRLPRTPGTRLYSTRREDLALAAQLDPIWSTYARYRSLVSHCGYLTPIGSRRHHPTFEILRTTGRLSCSGGLNLQALPRQDGERGRAVRECFVPAPDHVFLDADYRQVELVALAYHLLRTRRESELARRINGGEDIHRLVAAAALGKDIGEVTARERQAAKAITFGVPGGMGPATLAATARADFGVELTDDEAVRWGEAYLSLFPDVAAFLEDEHDPALVLATRLGLSTTPYRRAAGFEVSEADEDVIRSFLGWMLLRVLGDASPTTRDGRPYTPGEIAYFWSHAAPLADELPPDLHADLVCRRPGRDLRDAVLEIAALRTVVTATGRIRARASFTASRNTLFQGLSADGAIRALWRVGRAGFQIVNFVHDQIVVEVRREEARNRRLQLIDLMKQGMQEVLPDMQVEVECHARGSLHGDDTIDLDGD